MHLKEIIMKALKTIIKKQTVMNLSSKFIFIKIAKELEKQDTLSSLSNLKALKYIKDKSFKAITDEASRIIIKENITDLYNVFNINNCQVEMMKLDKEHDSKGNELQKDKEFTKTQKIKKVYKAILNQSTEIPEHQNILNNDKKSNSFNIENSRIHSYCVNNRNENIEKLKLVNHTDNLITNAIKEPYSSSQQIIVLDSNSDNHSLVENSKSVVQTTVNCSLKDNIHEKSIIQKNTNLLDFSEHLSDSDSDSFFKDLKSKYSSNINHSSTDFKEINALENQISNSENLKCDFKSFSSDLSDLNMPFEMKNYENEQLKDSCSSEIIILPLSNSPKSVQDLTILESKIFNSLSDLTLDEHKNSNIYNNDSSFALNSNTSLSFSSSGIKPTRNKKYIPGYRTAAYAILKALYLYNGSHKHLVVLRATPFTDSEFDRTQKFSAFSAFKSLERKGLIVCNSESKYFLTDSGMELANSLFSNETILIENNNEITVIVDSREKKNNRDRNYFQNYFTNKKIPNQTRYLALGDFIWIKNEKLIDFIVERKQSSDFVSSISDGRYKEQKKRLISLGLNVFYLIENLKFEESRRKFVERCLMEVRMQGFVVLQTDNIQESAFILEQIDKAVREGRKSEYIGYGSFLEETNKNKLKVNDMLLIALLSVKGLSKELAIELANAYQTVENFMKKAKEPQFQNELFSFRSKGREVGTKIGKRILELMA